MLIFSFPSSITDLNNGDCAALKDDALLHRPSPPRRNEIFLSLTRGGQGVRVEGLRGHQRGLGTALGQTYSTWATDSGLSG